MTSRFYQARLAPLALAILIIASGSVFADALPTIPPPLNASTSGADLSGGLSQILQTIAARSPDVLAARAAESQAEAQVQQTRAAFFGKVDAYALNQHFNDPRLTRAITQPPNVALYPFARNQFGYGVDVQLPIDLSGQIAAEVDAARSRANGAHWSIDDVRLRALLQGATYYRNLQSLLGQQAALQKQMASLKVSQRVAQAGLKVGNIAKVSLLRVEAAVANTQAQIAGIEGQMQKLRAQLAALMGVDSFDAPIVSEGSGPHELPADPNRLPPSIQAAISTLQSTQNKLEAAKRAMYPQFSINGGWNHNAIQWDQQAVNTWQLNFGVKLNLWAGGAQKSAIDAAQAASLESHYHLSAAEDNLRAAKLGALALWRAQKAVLAAAEAGLFAATESARIEQDRFRNGLGSATDLIDAEAALANASASVASALAGWWQADDALRYTYGEAPAALSNNASTPASIQP